MNLSIEKFLFSRTEFGYLCINSTKKFREKLWWILCMMKRPIWKRNTDRIFGFPLVQEGVNI